MKFNTRKLLLAGTAIIAAAAFSAQAYAADQTLTGPGQWASAGTAGGTDVGDASDAATSQTIDIDGNTLTVTNDGVADDTGGGGAGLNTFTLGAVTDTAGTGILTVVNGGANPLTTTIDSANVGGNVSFTTINGATTAQTDTITNDLTVGGALNISNVLQNTAGEVLAVSVGGNLDVTGTTALHGGIGAFADGATLTVTGTSHFGDAVTVTGGVNGGATTTMTLNGTTNAFDNGLTLTNGAAGHAVLALDGLTVAQTVTGDITGTGDITVANAAGVTFSGTVGGGAGTVVIENGGGALNSAATFKDTVNVTSITLGAAGTGTNTVTFDGTGGAFSVAGTVDGAIAGENDVVDVIGAHTITQSTAWGGVGNHIDTLAVSGSSTTLLSNAAIHAAATTVGTGATLNVNSAGILTSNVTLTGTGAVTLSSTGNVAGTIDGSAAGNGVLNVAATGNAAVTSNIGTGFSLSAINVATGGVLTADGDVKATTTTLTGTGALTLANPGAQAVVTNIVAAATGNGTVNVTATANTTTITGNIGTSSSKVGTFAVAGNAGGTVTTTGNLYVTNAITQGATDTIQFLGTGAQAVSGAITGGIVDVGNTSTTTFGGAVTGASSAVGAGATAIYAASSTYAGAYANATGATTQVNAGKTLTVGALTAAAGNTWNIGVDETAGVLTNGVVAATGTVDLTNDTLHFVVSGTQPLTAGTIAGVFTGTTGPAVITGATVTDNSFLYKFTPTVNVDNIDVAVALSAPLSTLTTSPNNLNVANVLLTGALTTSTNTQINEIQTELANASTQTQVNNILQSVQPTADGSNVTAGLSVGSQVFGVTEMRMASLEGKSPSGMAAGDMPAGTNTWGQIFGQSGTQDERDSTPGYHANTYGMAVGGDAEAMDGKGHMGAALSYARTNASSKNVNSTDTNINSYQITGYGDMALQDEMFLKGMVDYAYDRNNSTRHNVGLLGLDANGNYNANQIGARVELDRPYTIEGGMTLTPSAMADYAYYNAGSYTETGAGGADLNVNQDSLNKFDLGVALDAGWDLKNDDGSSFKPGLTAGYRYDLVGDQIQSTSSFTGGGAAFNTQGITPARSLFDVGANAKFYTTDNWDFSAEYTYQFGSDYHSHNGLLRAAYKF